jgi:hypothetical protein
VLGVDGGDSADSTGLLPLLLQQLLVAGGSEGAEGGPAAGVPTPPCVVTVSTVKEATATASAPRARTTGVAAAVAPRVRPFSVSLQSGADAAAVYAAMARQVRQVWSDPASCGGRHVICSITRPQPHSPAEGTPHRGSRRGGGGGGGDRVALKLVAFGDIGSANLGVLRTFEHVLRLRAGTDSEQVSTAAVTEPCQ